MAEYVKRDDALRALEQISPVDYGAMWDYQAHHYVDECLRDCKDELEGIPAADVAPVVHARWIPFHSEAAGDIQYCSACKIGFAAKTDFCPNCGAKMDGEE